MVPPNGYGGASGGTNGHGNTRHVRLRVRYARRRPQAIPWSAREPRHATGFEIDLLIGGGQTGKSGRPNQIGIKNFCTPKRAMAL
jgi:hypothetical protein